MTDIGTLYAQTQAEGEEQRWQRLLQGGQAPPPVPASPPAATPAPPGVTAGGVAKETAKGVVGLGEAAASFAGSGMEFLNPLPGLAGIIGTVTKGGLDVEAGTRTIQTIQDALHPYLVYQPQTDAGKFYIGTIHKAFELLKQFASFSGTQAQRLAQPLGESAAMGTGAAVETGVELIPLILGAGLGKIKAKLSSGKLLTVAERAVVEKNIAEVGEKLSGPRVLDKEGKPVFPPTEKIGAKGGEAEALAGTDIAAAPSTETTASAEAISREAAAAGRPTEAPTIELPKGPLISVTTVPFEKGTAFRRENPGSFTIGSKGVTVDWAAVDNPLAIGEIVEKTTELHRAGIVEAKRRVLGDKAVKELADRLSLTTDDLLSRHPGNKVIAEEAMAYIDLLNSSTDAVVRLAEQAKTGDMAAGDAMLRAWTAHQGVDSQARGVGSEFGRGLRIFQKASDETVHLRTVFAELGEVVGTGESKPLNVTPQRLAEMILAKGKAETPTFLKKFSVLDSALEAYYGFILGPKTVARNAMGNTAAVMIGVPVRWVAGTRPIRWLGGVKYEGVEHVAPGEAAAMLGFGEAGEVVSFQAMLRDSLQAAWKTLKTGERRHSASVFETRPGTGIIRAETYGLTGTIGRLVDWTGAVLRAVPRAIMGVDEFFGGIGYNMERNALAVRQATVEGHAGEAYGKRVADLVAELPEPLEKQAQLFGRTQTFSKDFEGRMKSLQSGVSHPLVKMTVLPFFRTPARLAEYSIEMVPGPNMLLKPYREDILAGGARREIALAKATVGAAILSTFGMLAYTGYVTGNGPRNKEARDNLQLTGWRPVSLYDPINNQYVSIAGMEPLSSHMAMAANMVAIGQRLPEGVYDDMFLLSALAVGEASLNKTYLQGVDGILDIFASGNPNEGVAAMRRQIASYLSPTVIRDLERQIDLATREVNSWWDEVKSRYPGASGTLPYHRDFFGTPIVTEGSWGPDIVSPFFISTRKNDPVSDEMARLANLGGQYGAPPKVIGGPAEQAVITGPRKTLPGVELTPEEYDRYVVIARSEPIGPGGRTLHESLEKLFASPPYNRASDGPRGGKVALRDMTVSRYDEAALLRLRKEFPRLHDAIVERTRTRIEERLPERVPLEVGQ